jgi:hypothetical protein
MVSFLGYSVTPPTLLLVNPGGNPGGIGNGRRFGGKIGGLIDIEK